MDKRGRILKIRRFVQAAFALLTNAHLTGFLNGRIYSGPLKRFCVPGMNCYSCPAALFACPLGSLQSMLAARKPKFPFFVLGYLALIGILLGRFICGWLCLFGLLQELLYKIPVRKLVVPKTLDHMLRKAKYVFLILFVILVPLLIRDAAGLGVSAFCKFICPVGTWEAGIPLVLANETLRQAVHGLYAWKMVLLVFALLAMVFIERPFCKYVCPLGAIYSLFQPLSFLQLKHSTDACTHCGKCASVCQMGVDPTKKANSAECIRCAACVDHCPAGALAFSFGNREKRTEKKTEGSAI